MIQYDKNIAIQLYQTVAPERRPDIVFHYTTQQGLIEIVQSGEIWATDVRYLNDEREFKYTVDIVRGVVEGWEARDEDEQKLFAEWKRGLNLAARVRCYVASFSEKSDQLSQWRAYSSSGTGLSVGVRVDDLRSTKIPPGTAIVLKCIYEATRQIEIVRESIEILLDEFHRLWPGREDSELDPIMHVAAQFFSQLLLLATCFKDGGFMEEEEWRLIIRATAYGQPAPRFRPGKGSLIPYLPVPLPRRDGRIHFPKVVVGPTTRQQLAMESVTALFNVEKISCEDVRPSAIPFREW